MKSLCSSESGCKDSVLLSVEFWGFAESVSPCAVLAKIYRNVSRRTFASFAHTPWTNGHRQMGKVKGRSYHVSPTRPERAEAPSPGQRPGLLWTQTCRPVRAKAFKKQEFIRLLPLQGALLIAIIPRAMPWARSFCPFRAYGAKQLELNSLNESRKRQRNFGFMCQKV